MQFSDELPMLYTTLAKNIERCIEEFGKIPDARKKTLENLSRFSEKKIREGKKAALVFICTHNSRRSHMAQLWAQAAAAFYGIPNVLSYSGGTEVTAFNSRAVKTMEEIGFQIKPTTVGENPLYEIRFSDDLPPIKGFSKKYDDRENPMVGFGAIMTCSHADQNCPFVHGAEIRIALPFDDPKEFDGTSAEATMYLERAFQIGRELLYAFSNIKISKT